MTIYIKDTSLDRLESLSGDEKLVVTQGQTLVPLTGNYEIVENKTTGKTTVVFTVQDETDPF